jgi:hypothetical protein
MGSTGDAIQAIKAGAPSDAEALARMFEPDKIPGDKTPTGRLRAILEATESAIVPGLQTGIKFHDTGFRAEFRDPWPSSDNQVGHFLTAVGLSFNSAKVEQNFFGRRLRDWMDAPGGMSAEEVAIRLTVGHEKRPDPGIDTVIEGAIEGEARPGLLGTLVPGPSAVLDFATGAFAGAASAVLNAFRAQFAACTANDVEIFRSAVSDLGSGKPLNGGAAAARLRGIRVVTSQRGNSYQDLLLSCYGWRLGQDIKNNRIATLPDVADWIRVNLM